MQHQEIEAVVRRASKEAVLETLVMLGFDTEDRPALRADLAHLRRWRVAAERVSGRAVTTAVTVIVTGFLGALWLILASYFHLRT